MSKLLNTMENLPLDCLQLIFSHLSDSDLKAISVVCKEFLINVNPCKKNLKVIHPKVDILSAHLKRFTEIRKIDLRNFDGDINEAIIEIAQSEIGLEALDISSRKGIRTETLTALGSNSKMKNLKVLKFHWVDYLQRDDFLVIANSFPNLEELMIGYSYHGVSNSSQFRTDNEIEFLASKLKLLKKINLSGKHIISDRSLVALSLSCVFLKDVTILCYEGSVTENGIGLLLRNRPNLEALSIAYVQVSPPQSTITIENSISYAKALTSLEFLNMKVPDELLKEITEAKLPLKKLGLNNCYNFTVTSLLMVLANSRFTELHLINNIADENVNLLLDGDVCKLTRIEISLTGLTKSTLLLLAAKCPSLENIRIIIFNGVRHEEVDDLEFLFPNLRVLDLCLCLHPITSKCMKAILKSCKFLRKLIISRLVIEVDDSELPELNLEELELSHSWIGDEWLAQIAKICPRLLSLDLSYCSKLTPEGIKEIVRNITTLNCLYIRNNDHINLGDLLDWMLSTGNFASLKRIYVGEDFYFSEEQRG